MIPDVGTSIVKYEGETAGLLTVNGTDPNEWEWESAGTTASRILENTPGELPNFIRYLAPEGELALILNGDAEPEKYIKHGMRFLSNVAIGITEKCFERIPADRISVTLADACEDHTFNGYYEGPKDSTSEHFNQRVGRKYKNPKTPRFSGAQLKLPMSLERLSDEPTLVQASEGSFTHILKYGGKDSWRKTIPVAEWMGLELSEKCGLPTAQKALLPLPNENAFALIVERFDIPTEEEAGKVSYFIADMCNISSIYPHTTSSSNPGKYDTPMEDIIEPLRAVSSDFEADSRALFQRTVFGYFLCDMDMHLKNLSVLKKVDLESGEIKARFAPTYDAVPTIIYPEEMRRSIDMLTRVVQYKPEIDKRLALPVNGEYEAGKDDLVAFAEAMGIPEEEAEEIIEHIGTTCAEEAIKIVREPPEVLFNSPEALACIVRAATEIVGKVELELVEDFSDKFDYDVRVWEGGQDTFMQEIAPVLYPDRYGREAMELVS